MPTTYTEDPGAPVFEIAVEGHVSREDFDAIAPRIEAFIARHGTVRMVEVVHDFSGFDPSLLWDGMKFDLKIMRHISHCAVVSDKGWIGPVTRVASAVMPIRLRTFAIADLDAARAWVRDPQD